MVASSIGKIARSSRTPATCCRSSPGWPPGPGPRRRRGTRRTCRPRRACAAFGDGEHQVGGGGRLRELAGEAEADDPRDQHGDRLAEHGRLRLDAADAPAEDAEAVLHRGVAVGADAGVGIRNAYPDPRHPSHPRHPTALNMGHDHAGEVLDVHLVDDAGARRDDAEAGERVLAPAQELEALGVALELERHVALERLGHAEDVGHHRVVDDQLGGNERVDLRRVAAQGAIASRMAARSTTAGTPVRSCRITRAGVNWISVSGCASGSQLARALMWSAVMLRPSSLRSRFSSSTFRLYGRFSTARDRVQAVDLVRRAARLKRRAAAEAVRSHRG